MLDLFHMDLFHLDLFHMDLFHTDQFRILPLNFQVSSLFLNFSLLDAFSCLLLSIPHSYRIFLSVESAALSSDSS